MRGVTTQVSEPKSNTACTMNLNKNPETHGSAPSLMRILVILFHNALAHDTLLTTSVQSLSSTKINHPRYRKEVTISRGSP